MSFGKSYMVTNRCLTNTPEKYGDTPQPSGEFSYAVAGTPYEQEGNGYEPTDAASFYSALAADLGTLDSPQLTVFIHGLDTDWNNACYYTALIGGNLNGINSDFDQSYPGLVIGFSWPSTTSVTDYLVDRENIRETADAFVNFITALQANMPDGCTVSVICHSEGNYMMKVGADALASAGSTGFFDQILLVAADLPNDALLETGYASAIVGAGKQVTVWCSNFDSVLAEADSVMYLLDELGEELNQKAFPSDYENWWPTWMRLGSSGVAQLESTADSVFNISCTLVDQSTNLPDGISTHVGYFYLPQLMDDMGSTLSGGSPNAFPHSIAVDRNVILFPSDDSSCFSQLLNASAGDKTARQVLANDRS